MSTRTESSKNSGDSGARTEIAEIDVNPLLVRPAGQGVVTLDALVIVAEDRGR
jgi:hypothetical protein